MSNDTTPQKTCTKCGQTFPAKTEYFQRSKGGREGLRGECKSCRRAYQEKNKAAIAEYQREYYQVNRDEIRERQREHLQAHPGKRREYQREYYRANRDEIREHQGEYYQVNRDEIRKHQHKYQKANRDKKHEYYLANRAKSRISTLNRRARKRQLPNTFTPEQWIVCVEYFNHRCAACEKQMQDLFGEIHIHRDHWIPLSSDECPGTTADNIVCLCSECNLSKSAKHPKQWLIEKFGKRKAAQILERIQTYFEWAQLPK